MDDLTKANNTLSTIKDMRIIYIPPFTVAASHYFGEIRRKCLETFKRICERIGLHRIKPDLRVFGFNNPSPIERNIWI